MQASTWMYVSEKVKVCPRRIHASRRCFSKKEEKLLLKFFVRKSAVPRSDKFLICALDANSFLFSDKRIRDDERQQEVTTTTLALKKRVVSRRRTTNE
jgi:hypothetical protein